MDIKGSLDTAEREIAAAAMFARNGFREEALSSAKAAATNLLEVYQTKPQEGDEFSLANLFFDFAKLGPDLHLEGLADASNDIALAIGSGLFDPSRRINPPLEGVARISAQFGLVDSTLFERCLRYCEHGALEDALKIIEEAKGSEDMLQRVCHAAKANLGWRSNPMERAAIFRTLGMEEDSKKAAKAHLMLEVYGRPPDGYGPSRSYTEYDQYLTVEEKKEAAMQAAIIFRGQARTESLRQVMKEFAITDEEITQAVEQGKQGEFREWLGQRRGE